MRYFLLNIFLLLLIYEANTQCFRENNSFKDGEVLRYLAYYNWGFVWLDAGWVEFSVKQGEYQEKETYLLQGYGSSHKAYDWFFKVRDRYRCHLDKETLLPLWFHRKNYEGGFEVDNKYVYDHPNNRLFSQTQNSDKPYSEDTISIPECTFDVLSLVYYARNIDFNSVAIGDSMPVISIIDNEVYPLYIRYLGKEVIKTKKGEKYKCVKFSALLVEGTIFAGGEDLFVWVTDDENKIPVLVEAKIVVGSVKAYLVGVKDSRYPITSQIN